jgi:hypothetical protein
MYKDTTVFVRTLIGGSGLGELEKRFEVITTMAEKCL